MVIHIGKAGEGKDMDLGRLREIAHRSMATEASPFLRHQKNGKHQIRQGVAFTRQELPGPGFNFAAVVDEAPPLDRVVEMCKEFFVDCHGGYGILVEADAGNPIEAEMQRRGWTIAEEEPALVLPSIPESIAPPLRLSIREITDTAGLDTFLDTLSEAFETSRDLPATFWKTSCLGDPNLVFFIGYCDGQPVATAVVGRLQHIATIHGVATTIPYRRRGFGEALTWAAVFAGAELGCDVSALRAMGASFEMYRKMGFVHVCNHRTYTVPESA
jgi:hypothetical protein